MRLRLLLASLAVAALFLACEEPTSQQPVLRVDPAVLDFQNRYIGTQPQGSIQVFNDGLDDLTLSGVEKSGSGAFTMNGPLETTVTGRKSTFIQVIFTPTQAVTYEGQLTIHSNAGDQVVSIKGVGVTPQ